MISLLLAMTTALLPSPPPVTADLLLTNGKIWAGKALPRADAIAIRDGRILAVGKASELASLRGPQTKVVDLEGRFAMPGFNDAHLHFLGGGEDLLTVDYRTTRTEAEFVARLGEYVSRFAEGTWILKGRWDHEVWEGKKLPDRRALDQVSPRNPVLLPRVDGHMAVANSAALKIAGITSSTADPAGGTIDRGADGEPTGILRDTAIDLVRRHAPPPSFEENVAAARAAMKEAARHGITSVQDNSKPEALRAYSELLKKGELTVRISYWRDLAGLNDIVKAEIPGGLGNEWLRFSAIKIFADGSLGSATAALHGDYLGKPQAHGLLILSPKELETAVAKAARAGFGVHVHAIGDRANTLVLDAFARERATQKTGAILRIEHAQLVREADLQKFVAASAIASIQPCHALTDMQWAASRISLPVLETGYRIASFRKAGIEVAFGTDWPVEPIDPRRNLFAAVARTFPDGSGGWTPGEKVSLEDALDMATRGSAAAEGLENVKGTLAPGKLADLVVFEKDPFDLLKTDPRLLLTAEVSLTIAGGRVVYEKKP
ncbi:MAG: N-substituted formamide deformylase [Thermoanaerobaculia bacterium]|nr:N-substituted formamide deformylase [Thermoanaerobaculia bacterium]